MTVATTIAVAAPGLARAANPAANIDQCRNGTVAAPEQCANSAWVNGNLGETNSHYREADFVPFRATLTNLDTSAPTHSVTIQYDTLQGTNHAYDYLGSYNHTEATADPTTGLSGLSAGNCFAVPLDLTNVFTNPGSSQTPGCIQIWNGTITGVSYGVADPSDKRSVVVSFTASDPTVLLAWGGHIASQIDWGLGNSASAISGSPYHMRLLTLDGTQLGNQDRSIKAAAILPIPPTFTTQTDPSAISAGQSVTDTATLSGSSSNGPVTGTVTFFVCGPAVSNPDCTFGGTQVGAPQPVDGSGHAVSAPFSPSVAGHYCFRAEYAPDSTAAYSPSHHTNLTTECFSVSNPSLQISKTADAATVSAGDPIGFTISVSNPGPGTALGVTVSDPLPIGTGISWAVDAANSDSGCSVAANTLSCSFGDLAPSASRHVHVTSPTTNESCKTYANTATAQATNNAAVQASASTSVACAQIAIDKTADAATVSAGDQIGFTLTLSNGGAGIARNVSAYDLLPATPGTVWSIDAANSDPGWSLAAGAASYGPHDLAPGASVHVHLVSPTTKDSCGLVDNSASVTTSNDGSGQDEASVVVNCPDLEVTKTAAASPVDAGDTAAFGIKVANVGSGIARNVTLDDPLPGGLSWAADDGDCSIASGTLHCSFGDLAPNASRTVHVSAPTTPTVCGVLPNTATALASNEPGDALENNHDSASITVDCPDVKVVKTADAATVSAGDQLGFTVTVSNLGPGTAKDVSMTDALPTDAGLDFSIADQSDPGTCSLNPAKTELSCAKPSLAAGQSFSVHVVSPTTADTCGTVSNTATGAAVNEAAAGLGNNSDGATVHVDCPALTIEKTADDGVVSAGDQIGFTVTVANSGPGAAHDVVVSDDLPTDAGLDFTIADQSDPGVCSLNAGKTVLSCAKASLAANARFSVHLVSPTKPATCGTVENLATVEASNDVGGRDSASVQVDCPDVTVVKTADSETINAGEPAAFTIVVTNLGPGVARNVTLNDPLPGGISWSEDSPDCNIVSGTLGCSFGDLQAEASRTVHVTGATSPADCGTLHNTAHVASANEPDGNLENNEDSASVAVECPNLTLTKTADAPSVKAGQQLGFKLTVTNSGAGTAKAVHVTDHLPTNGGLAFAVDAAASDAGCEIHSGTLECSFGDLRHSESKTVHLVSPTSEAACGKVDNSAVADSSNGSPAHASASVDVTCPLIDLAITKIDDPDPVTLGNLLTYTLGVRNNGPDTATDVTVTDSLPSEATFVSAAPSQGSCIGDRVITCKLGTLAAGGTATIVVVVRPTATGTIVNNAVVGGHEAESDTSNNSASADTRVIGKKTPPVCYTLTVRPRVLTVGHRTVVRVIVRARGRAAAGIRVSLRGAGIARTASTNRHGVARLVVKPTKTGVVRIRVPHRRSCTTQEIGVAGVLKPPHFTG